MTKSQKPRAEAATTAQGLLRFKDLGSMEATLRRQFERTYSAKSFFGSPTLVGSTRETGSDRISEVPGVEAQLTSKPASDDYSCLNLDQPDHSSSHFTIPELEPWPSDLPCSESDQNFLNSPDFTMATAMGSVSPSRSPRLPSPPPFPEVQIGPKSPGFHPEQSMAIPENNDTAKLDNGAMRRIRPGTKAADMAFGPPLVPLAELDSPFQLQEHLKALYHHHTKPSSSNTTIPINHETALVLANPPENVDRSLWLYELCRFLVQKANNLIVAFFAEEPPCSSKTCPEMRASEWQYLCAVHDPPKACCAIDYCCHTLDWAANVLTSQKQFPSRLTLGTDATGGAQQSVRHLTNIFRRVYRIFAHAWFQHRQVFWQVEANEGLYIFFKKVCDVYNLIQEDNYTISPEAEGIVTSSRDETNQPAESGMVILKKPADDEGPKQADENTTTTISTGATTRRHKHTPSTGSLVPTIAEGDEDDNHEQSPDQPTNKTPSSVPQPPPAPNPTEPEPQPQRDKSTPAPEPGPSPLDPVADVQNEPKHDLEPVPKHETSDEAATVPEVSQESEPEALGVEESKTGESEVDAETNVE